MKKLIQGVFATLTFGIAAVQAGEIGHFAPGVLGIPDFAMPEPGFLRRDLQLRLRDRSAERLRRKQN